MTIYRYSSNCLIDEVRIISNATGGHRAYIHARSDAGPEQLSEIKHRLNDMGWKTVPISHEGKALLEVRGFKAPAEFNQCVRDHGWCVGAPVVETPFGDQISKKEKQQNSTLGKAGGAYLFGDACYMTYATMGLNDEKRKLAKLVAMPGSADMAERIAKQEGAVLGEKHNIMAGVGYALGSVSLAAFGNKDRSADEIKTASRKIQNFMLHEGIQVQQDSPLHDASKKEDKGFFARAGDFARKYPSEILNVLYVGVGALIMSRSFKKIAALKANKEPILHDVIDTGLGATTLTASLAGLLIKEKKPEPGEEKKHGIARAWQWIQEKPLRVTGYGLMLSTLFHAVATVGKYKEGDVATRKTIMWRGGFVAANIAAEILMAISSKGHGEGVKTDHSTEDTVIANTAEQIARQNPAYQNQLVDQLSGFMASSDVLGGKAETIASKLREQLATIQKNPWATATAPIQPTVKKEEAPVISMHPRTTIAADSVDLGAREMIKAPEMLNAVRA